MKKMILGLALFALMLVPRTNLLAHCEVPCGIYHDELRFELIDEHIETISKSMTKIQELSGEKVLNYNQIVRWVNTKEEHATKIQDIVSQYFLTQRIKVVSKREKSKYSAYESSLKYLHQMIINSMKCKQSTNLDYVKMLTNSTKAFKKLYLGEHAITH